MHTAEAERQRRRREMFGSLDENEGKSQGTVAAQGLSTSSCMQMTTTKWLSCPRVCVLSWPLPKLSCRR